MTHVQLYKGAHEIIMLKFFKREITFLPSGILLCCHHCDTLHYGNQDLLLLRDGDYQLYTGMYSIGQGLCRWDEILRFLCKSVHVADVM